jgi:hypothetical protein
MVPAFAVCVYLVSASDERSELVIERDRLALDVARAVAQEVLNPVDKLPAERAIRVEPGGDDE